MTTTKKFDVWVTSVGGGQCEVIAKEVEGDNFVQSVVNADKIPNQTAVAKWLAAQPWGTWDEEEDVQKRYTLEYTGAEEEGKTYVSHSVEAMPENDNESSLLGLDNLGTSTDTEINTYVTVNVLTLVNLITYVKEISKALVYQREILKSVLKRQRIGKL